MGSIEQDRGQPLHVITNLAVGESQLRHGRCGIRTLAIGDRHHLDLDYLPHEVAEQAAPRTSSSGCGAITTTRRGRPTSSRDSAPRRPDHRSVGAAHTLLAAPTTRPQLAP